MAKIVKFPVNPPEKKGPSKVFKRKRKPDPEDFGQLNMFSQGREIHLDGDIDVFDKALRIDEKNDEQALLLYQKAIKKKELKADAYCNMGIIMTRQEKLSKAIDYFTLSLKSDPRHFESHYNLANVYSDKGNYDLAIMHYEVAIEINPKFSDTHYNLGLAYIAKKSYPQALEQIDIYVEQVPHDEARDLRHTLKTIIG